MRIQTQLFRTLALRTLASLALVTTIAAAPGAEQERRFPEPVFHQIELHGSDALTVVPGNAISVVARGDQATLDSLDIVVRGDLLRIGRKPGTYHHTARITVTMPSITALKSSGSGSATVSGFRLPAFDAALSGSGDIVLRDLSADSLSLALNGSGDITASGRAERLTVADSGSGSVDTRALEARDGTFSLAGSGEIKGQARGSATVNSAGSGDIDIAGHPRCTVASHGSGGTRCG